MGNCISPLRRAIRFQDVKGVQKIMDEAGEGAPDLINDDYSADCFLACFERNYQDPLQTAMTHYDVGEDGINEIVKLLVKYGADVNSEGLWGQSPIHKAARQDCLPLAKFLVANGANIYVQTYVERDNFGFYPIHLAAASSMSRMHAKRDVLTYLLEVVGKPEDINMQDGKGHTPLHIACKWENPTTVAYLIEKGADLHAKNHEGKTPRDLAKPQVVELVEKAMQQNR